MQVPPTGIGEALRHARETRRLSLADAERLTKIRAFYLAALEEERFHLLPPRPYATGFLRAYARLLGLDPESLVAAVDARLPPATGAGLGQAVEVPLEPAAPPSRLRRLFTYALWALALLAIFLAYVGYIELREFCQTGPCPAFLSPAPPRAPLKEPAGRGEDPGLPPPPTTAPASPPPEAPPSAAPEPQAAGVSVSLTASGTSWLRVTADGQRVFQGFVHAGDARTWTAERELLIRIGNAGAVELTVNGRPLGVLGELTEVVERRFTRSSEAP